MKEWSIIFAADAMTFLQATPPGPAEGGGSGDAGSSSAAEIADLKSKLELADRLVEETAEKIAELEEKRDEVKKLEAQLEAAKVKEARTINVMKSGLESLLLS